MAAVVKFPLKPAITKPKPKLPRQKSVRAFTAEDLDVHSESAGWESPEVKDSSVTLREKTPEEKAAATKRQTKRRSKSVGAPDFHIRLLPAYLNSIGQSSKKPKDDERQVTERKSSKTKTEKKANIQKDPPECEKMLNAMKDLGFPGGPGVSPHNTMPTKHSYGKRNVQGLPGTGKQSVNSLPGHEEQNVQRLMESGKQSIDGLPYHSIHGLPGADEQGDNGLPGTAKNVQGQAGPGRHSVVGLPHQGQVRPGSVKQIVDSVHNVLGLPGHDKEIDNHQETSSRDDAAEEFNKSPTENTKKPIITIEIPLEGDTLLVDSGISEEKSPTSTIFKKKGLAPPNRCAVGNKKLTRKLSRKLTGRMTQRQRQQLMLEGEFDEFDVGMEEAEETKDRDSIKSPPESDEEGSVSDDTDHEFETEIVTQLNIERSKSEDDDGSTSGDDSSVVEMTKTQRIANELLTTERSYVKKLHLLDQVFHLRIVRTNREDQMFPENVIPRMFSNIKSIYQFHNDFLLPQLERRMAEWHAEPRFGDVMRKFAPFLKLYSEYVKNFDCAMKMINFWTDRSPKFARLLADIQKEPECGHLTLQHHMLEPIQRVPRYQLLLKDYLRHLDVHSVDRQDTEKALDLVAMAATHSNEAMRKIEKFRKLLGVNERLAGTIDLINPSRELVKEGKIIRISARDGDHIERYLFLFNDLLLVCQSLPLIIGTKQQFKIKSKIDVEGLQVFEGHNLETPNTFYVQGQQKSIELHTSSVEEKLEWQNALDSVIAEHNNKRSVRRASVMLGNHVDREIIGKVPPVWIKDQETSMCMNCTTTFTTFRRRHHCRACGHVICGKCSSHKAPLIYNDNIVSRVCDTCYEILCPVDPGQSKAVQSQASVRNQPQQQQHQPQHKKLPVILQVKASDPCVLSGYLHISCNKKTWLRRWFSVRDNFVLYSFKAHQDVVALTSLPLPGYNVVPVEPKDGIDRENTLKVFHNGDSSKVYFLQTEDEASLNRWIDVLQKVVQLELPPAEKQPDVHSPTAQTFIPDDLDDKQETSINPPSDC